MDKLYLQLLGPLQLHTPAGRLILPRRQPLALLSYLAVAAQPVPRDTLALLLCGQCDETTARGRIRRMLHELRSALRAHDLPDLVRLAGDTVALDLERCEVDVLAFVQAAAENNPLALEWYRGPLLDGFHIANVPDFEAWLVEARERFALLYLALLGRLANHAAAQQNWSLAADYAQRLLAVDPLQEEAHIWLIEAHAANRHLGPAVRQYEQLRDLLRRELDVEPLPETTARLESLWHGRAAQAPVPTTVLPGEPLVGRTRERAAIREAYQRARTIGMQLVCIEGVSGIGKTRLVDEALVELLALPMAECATVLRVVCHEQLATAPYGALAEAFRALLPPNEDPFLRPPRTQGDAEIALWERLLAAIRRVAAQSAAACLVFAIDDLQWADSAFLRALLYIIRRFQAPEPHSPACLVLITVRSEAQPPAIADFVRSLARFRHATRMRLLPLNAEEVKAFVQAYVGTNSGTLGERLFHETEGNPFVLVEMLRELRHSGALERYADQGEFPLPPNVRAALEERFLRLPTRAQQLAEAAAVLGREIDLDLLRRVASVHNQHLIEQLEQLEAAGFVHAKHGSYQFAHGKTQAILYNRLSEARRRLLHRRAAQALDRSGQPRHAAQALAHAQRSHEWELAVRAARRAATEARRITARADALAFEQAALHALDALGNDKDRITVLFAYEDDAHLLGERAAQTEALEQLAHCSLDADQQTLVMYRRGRNAAARGRYAEAQVLLQQALGAQPAPPVRFSIQLELANCLSQQGAHAPAQQVALQALADAQATRSFARQLQAYLALAQIAQTQDDTDHALSWLNHAQPLAAAQPELRADILASLARTYSRRGNYAQMLRHAADAHALAFANGNARLQADCLRLQGIAAGRLYRFAEAENAYSRAHSLYAALDDPQGNAAAILNLAIVRYRVGDFGAAHAAAAEAYQLATNIPDRRGQAIAAINLATISIMAGNGEAAEQWARTAAALADELNSPLVRAIASTNLAGALLHQGQFAQARAAFTQTLALRPAGDIGRIADLTWLAFTCLQLGEFDAANEYSSAAVHELLAHPGIDIPQQVYAVRALVLHTGGDAPGASEAIQTAFRTLHEQLQHIPSAADRQRYFGSLATNRFITAAQHGDWTSEHPLF